MVPVDCVYWDEMASWSEPEQYEALMRVCLRRRKGAEMVHFSTNHNDMPMDPEAVDRGLLLDIAARLARVERKVDEILGEDKRPPLSWIPRKSQTLDALKCPVCNGFLLDNVMTDFYLCVDCNQTVSSQYLISRELVIPGPEESDVQAPEEM